MKKNISTVLTALILVFSLAFPGVSRAGRAFAASDAGAPVGEGDVEDGDTGSAAPSDCVVLVFDDDEKYAGFFDGRVTDVSDVSYDNEKKCYVLSVGESTDPFIEMLFGTFTETGKLDPVSADKYKVIQFGVRYDTGAGREGQFYFQTTSNMDYKEAQNLSYMYKGTDNPQFVNVDASGNAAWTGTVADCRFDMLTLCRYDVEFEVYYAGFFIDQEAADAYGNAWLKAMGVDGGEDEHGSQGGTEEQVSAEPFDLILFDRRAENVNIALGEALFEAEKHSQIDSAYADKNSNSFKLAIQSGADPYIEMMFGALTDAGSIAPVSCADYKVLQIAMRSNVAVTSLTGTVYFQTDQFSGYSETKNVHYKYQKTDELQFLNVDLGAHKLWEGYVANCRYDMFENVNKDIEMDIYYVAFFRDVEAAEEFSAKYLEWVEKGGAFPAEYPVKTVSAPTEVPTDAPTQEPGATKDPAATGIPVATVGGEEGGSATPGGSGEDRKSGGSFPVVPVVIGAVVLAAAGIIIGITAAKKRKR
jgi:hypothetical protein